MKNELFLLNIDDFDSDYFIKKQNDIYPDFIIDKLSSVKSLNAYRSSLGAWTLLSYALYFLNLNYKLRDYNFIKNDFGKYFVQGNHFYFNISHSGNYVLVSIADHQVGCDIEIIKKPNLNIAKRFFTEEENMHILSINDEKIQENLFFRYWTMKESYVKCLGQGLSIPLNSFSVILNDDINTINNINNLYIKEYKIDGCCCCVCAENFEFNERLNIIKCEDLLHLF